MADLAVDVAVKFHLSLNVSSLEQSIEFYRVLFGIEPAKQHPDYAKFELEDPPVVFSLAPRAPGPGGTLSHLGFRVSSLEEICRVKARLEQAGICTQDQSGTVCGYARQDKLWAKDPDGNFWEVYVIEEDVDPASVRRSLDGPPARPASTSAAVVWEHYVSNPLNGPIPHADGTVDEVRLTGTCNGALNDDSRAFVVREAFRVLKAGGKLVCHGLMADRPLIGSSPKLPGLAALVSRVPSRDEVVACLLAAGFAGVQATKLTEAPWFVHDGVGLREVKFVAWKPTSHPVGKVRQVLYKGPFAEVTADGGLLLPRGRRMTVPAAVWDILRQGAAAEQFLFFEPDECGPCGCQ
jgi:catechol 2,3-dioxygenase-like lactoylglutathione lyase family enzyme